MQFPHSEDSQLCAVWGQTITEMDERKLASQDKIIMAYMYINCLKLSSYCVSVSPPRGPQTVDLISCTPDCIQAKTVTEINGRSTSSLDKVQTYYEPEHDKTSKIIALFDVFILFQQIQETNNDLFVPSKKDLCEQPSDM